MQHRAQVLSYLLSHLRKARSVKAVRMVDDYTIRVKMHLEEVVHIYYVDSPLTVAAISRRMEKDTYRNIHTLFILSAELLPAHRTMYQPNEAMRLLFDIYNGFLYVGRVTPRGVQINRVHIDDDACLIFGAEVEVENLSCDYTAVDSPHLSGVRNIADFEKAYYHADSFTGGVSSYQRHPLQEYYDVLEVTVDADASAIKRAYRRKAHQNHPDRDPSPEATARMQRINEAYAEIMKQWR